jgi:hypothetical protein
VQARDGEAGDVADVVQPGGGFQQIGVHAENGCQAVRPGGSICGVAAAWTGGGCPWLLCVAQAWSLRRGSDSLCEMHQWIVLSVFSR